MERDTTISDPHDEISIKCSHHLLRKNTDKDETAAIRMGCRKVNEGQFKSFAVKACMNNRFSVISAIARATATPIIRHRS